MVNIPLPCASDLSEQRSAVYRVERSKKRLPEVEYYAPRYCLAPPHHEPPVKRFRRGETERVEDERSGRPNEAVNDERLLAFLRCVREREAIHNR